MEVILRTHVEKLGNRGEIVKVEDRAIQLKENLGGRDTGTSPC